jgi:hypothetical protein
MSSLATTVDNEPVDGNIKHVHVNGVEMGVKEDDQATTMAASSSTTRNSVAEEAFYDAEETIGGDAEGYKKRDSSTPSVGTFCSPATDALATPVLASLTTADDGREGVKDALNDAASVNTTKATRRPPPIEVPSQTLLAPEVNMNGNGKISTAGAVLSDDEGQRSPTDVSVVQTPHVAVAAVANEKWQLREESHNGTDLAPVVNGDSVSKNASAQPKLTTDELVMA